VQIRDLTEERQKSTKMIAEAHSSFPTKHQNRAEKTGLGRGEIRANDGGRGGDRGQDEKTSDLKGGGTSKTWNHADNMVEDKVRDKSAVRG